MLGIIGSLGDVVFETSTSKIRTFDNFTRSGSARWGTHEIINQQPVMEFIGPGQDEITFTVRLDLALGVDPNEELTTLREIRDTGEALTLIIGGEPVTDNFWVLEALREQHKIIDGNGQLVLVEVELNLREYPELGEQTDG